MKENHICTCGDCSIDYKDKCKFESVVQKLQEINRDLLEALKQCHWQYAEREIHCGFCLVIEKAEKGL